MEIELVAATQGPGLVGALLVGSPRPRRWRLPGSCRSRLSTTCRGTWRPTSCSTAPAGTEAFEPPFVCLIASGGHTLLAHVHEHEGFEVLGRTLDDAAGEAFDKGARMLGLGYPGGAALERLAAGGDPEAFVFPGSREDRARGGWGTRRSPGRRSRRVWTSRSRA